MDHTADSALGNAEPAVAHDRGLPRGALRRVTVVLCATEIVSWGILYYAFAIFNGHPVSQPPSFLTVP